MTVESLIMLGQSLVIIVLVILLYLMSREYNHLAELAFSLLRNLEETREELHDGRSL